MMRWISFLTGMLLAMGMAAVNPAIAFQTAAADDATAASRSVLFLTHTATAAVSHTGAAALPMGGRQETRPHPGLPLLLGSIMMIGVIAALLRRFYRQHRMQPLRHRYPRSG